ncbi:MAG: hypothetical protein ABI836_09240 [Gemmatimonadota bacterium]
MMSNACSVGLVLALLGFSTAALQAQGSGDGCSLLKGAEVQALAGAAKVGPGTASSDALGSRLCRYEWGIGNNAQHGRSVLDVSITPISKAFPGTDAALLRQGLLAKARQPNTAVIPGVGDAAIYESSDPIHVAATAMTKGNMLIVTLESADARGKKDQVIALLKAAAGRL